MRGTPSLGSDRAAKTLESVSGRSGRALAAGLEINAGELLVVLGPSGSGKSTLLRLIAGLESPSSGGVWIDGRDLSGVPPHRRDVAMVFQNPALYPHFSVFDNLAFGVQARGVSGNQARCEVNTVAGHTGARPCFDAVSQCTFRRRAAAGGDRPRAGAAAAHHPVRRAVFESRRSAARRACANRWWTFTAGSERP